MPAASAAGIFPRNPRRPSYAEEFAEGIIFSEPSAPQAIRRRRFLEATRSEERVGSRPSARADPGGDAPPLPLLGGAADAHCAIAVEEIATQDAVPVGRSIAWP
jgi:hypothetical protein